MSVRNLKENEIVLSIDDEETFEEIMDEITDIIDDEDVEIVDAQDEIEDIDDSEIIDDVADEVTDEIDDTEIIDEPLEDEIIDDIEDVEEEEDEELEPEVTVNGDPVDAEFLKEEGEEVEEPSLDSINSNVGAEIEDGLDESLEVDIEDVVDVEEIEQFYAMDNKDKKEIENPETLDDIIDEEGDDFDTLDDITKEEKPSGLMKEDLEGELVDDTPKSIPAGLDTVKGKLMAIAEEINGLTGLTSDVETVSIIADLYNSAVALALDVEGAVDTYKELAEEAIQDEVEEVEDKSAE